MRQNTRLVFVELGAHAVAVGNMDGASSQISGICLTDEQMHLQKSINILDPQNMHHANRHANQTVQSTAGGGTTP